MAPSSPVGGRGVTGGDRCERLVDRWVEVTSVQRLEQPVAQEEVLEPVAQLEHCSTIQRACFSRTIDRSICWNKPALAKKATSMGATAAKMSGDTDESGPNIRMRDGPMTA